jgi:acetyltransferase-like isoleucine patch superfamily enzyme
MLFQKLVNIFKNIFYFFVTLRHGRVNWSFIAKVIIDSQVSSKTVLNSPCHLNNVKISDFTYLAQNAWISYTSIGRFSSVGPNFFCGWGIHPTNAIATSPMFYSTRKQNGFTLVKNDKIIERKHINIGNDVFIGANVTILDGVNIGDGVIVGANSLVNIDIPPYAIVGGSPAKIIKYRFDQEKIDKLLKIKWWDWPDEKIQNIEKSFFDIDKFLSENLK